MNRLSLIFTITILAGISTLLYLASPVDAVTSRLGAELRSSKYADIAVDEASSTSYFGLNVQKGTVRIGQESGLGAGARLVVNGYNSGSIQYNQKGGSIDNYTGKYGSTGDAIYAFSSSTNSAVVAEQNNSSGYSIYSTGGKNYFGNKVRIRDPYWSSASQSPTSTLDVWGSLSMHIGTVVGQYPSYPMGDAVFTILGNVASGAVSLSLPSAASVPGRIYVAKNIAAGYGFYLSPAAGDTIDGADSLYLNTLYDFAMIQSSGSDWYVISTNF